MAAFTRGESPTARATRSASPASRAPSTTTRTACSAPSPSRTIWIASQRHTAASAAPRRSRSAPASSGPPPPAITMSVSEGLICPSTLMRLNDAAAAADVMAWSSGAATRAATVM